MMFSSMCRGPCIVCTNSGRCCLVSPRDCFFEPMSQEELAYMLFTSSTKKHPRTNKDLTDDDVKEIEKWLAKKSSEQMFGLKITSDNPCPFSKPGKVISKDEFSTLAERDRCILRDEVPCVGDLKHRPKGCPLEVLNA